MTPENGQPTLRKSLRLWPGVVAVVFQWLAFFVVPAVAPEQAGFGVLGGAVGGLLIILWWLFFSRARWLERVGALVLMVGAVFGTSRLVHPSIAGGMMGLMLPVYAIPIMCLTLVAWAVATSRLPIGIRRVLLLGAILVACGFMTLVRTGGLSSTGGPDLHWRWTKTPEERLLAQTGHEPAARAATTAATAGATTKIEWPGFRGPERDGTIHGIQIATDWSRSAPVELWRRQIGPGWSSFAVQGNFVYTQEQRGDDEVVSCYNLVTGVPLWQHSDHARFWESNAGAGPRGTPTLSNGRVFAFGGTGILNALDAQTGSVVWSRNAASDTHRKVPHWGFASSPLVVGEMVIIATAGTLAAYDIAKGQPRWVGPTNGWGYSSPHLATIDGVEQIVLLNGAGAISVSPTDGKLLWNHEWKSDGIVQPALLAGGDVLLGSGSGFDAKVGMRRLAVARDQAGWKVEERWTSTGLKPYFNDFVVHKGHAYGFDGSLLSCIDLSDGKRNWKGGRYGQGQLVGLPDQDLLLVLSEQGELALVKATPEQFTELARHPALMGKTWNHPALVGDELLVRNDHEMVAFRLALAKR